MKRCINRYREFCDYSELSSLNKKERKGLGLPLFCYIEGTDY